MSFPTRFQGSTALIAAGLVFSPAAALADDEEEDGSPHVLIGQVDGGTSLGFAFEGIEPNPASGSLIIPIEVFGDPFSFPLPSITGFSSTPFNAERDLAFEAPGVEEADELAEADLVPLSTTAQIAIEAVALDDDFAIFLDGVGLLDAIGGTLALGSPEFDNHPFYILETTDSLTLGQTTTGTFRLIDTSSGGLSPSGTFDITLEVVPEPGTATLALAGTALLLRRRRAMV